MKVGGNMLQDNPGCPALLVGTIHASQLGRQVRASAH